MAYDNQIKAGTTSKIIEVMVRDSTTGGGKTGLAYTAVSASYCREGSTRTAITLASGSAGASYSSGKWAEVDATNMKGLYQFHAPDASLATGVAGVTFSLQATGMLDKSIKLKLVAVNDQDGVRYGLSAFPNVATGTAGAIPTVGTGTAQINLSGGRADANATYFGGTAGTFAAGIPSVNTIQWLGTAVTAATAGVPNVNAARVNNVATTSVTTVNANIGTTQPINFINTGATAYIKVEVDAYASGFAPLQPTVAGRTLDVTATGEAGIDLANVGSPTTTLNLSGTTIKAVTDTVAANVTQFGGVNGTFAGGFPTVNIGSVDGSNVSDYYIDFFNSFYSTNTLNANVTSWLGSPPNALISGNVPANAQFFASNAVNASALATDAVTEIATAVNNLVPPEAFFTNSPSGGGGGGFTSDDRDTLDAVKVKTDLITTGRFNVVSPVATTGQLTIIQGDDYTAPALTWTIPSYTGPEVTAVTFAMAQRYGPDIVAGGNRLEVAGTAVMVGIDLQITVQLTHAQTATLDHVCPWAYAYQVLCYSGAVQITRIKGLVTVEARVAL